MKLNQILNTQELYNYIRVHLLAQGVRSMRAGHCAYYGTGDRKCAIGCVIAEEHYSPSMERCCGLLEYFDGNRVCDMVRKSVNYDLTSNDVQLLNYLQSVHDEKDPSNWSTYLPVDFDVTQWR